MRRRDLLKTAASTTFLSAMRNLALAQPPATTTGPLARSRPRPGDSTWPSSASWDALKRDVGGRLLVPNSPFTNCLMRSDAACEVALNSQRNPFYLGDQVALTQTSGWVDAWTSQPSAYAVAAASTADVAAAVKFARIHDLRLVVKGGGHSYQGTSNAPDSLLIWTRAMNSVALHDGFVAQGCKGKQMPQPAVTVGAGAMWIDAYHAVTTLGGRYVQGGGCATVGVAGHVQSGGFGSWSKRYGTAAAGLLEAEIVTAEGKVRIANECTNPDLFWGIKGGGGGSLGVITRLTLRTRELPEFFGGVIGMIKASSDDAYRALIGRAVKFYRSDLCNPFWGEKMIFHSDNRLEISMVFQGFSQQQAQSTWAPFFDWVRANADYTLVREPAFLSVAASRFWDAEYMQQHFPAAVMTDRRSGSPRHHMYWAENTEEAGQFLHGYKSVWLPVSLLESTQQPALVDALFASTRHWGWALHFNKGLAGAPAEEIAAARNTATNPDMLDAFALAIIAGEGPPAFNGMPGAEADLAHARINAASIGKAMDELLKVAPGAGAYLAESDYFQSEWQTAFWGSNYPRLAAVKRKYDPGELFFVHHGVGSEGWSADGFTRLRG